MYFELRYTLTRANKGVLARGFDRPVNSRRECASYPHRTFVRFGFQSNHPPLFTAYQFLVIFMEDKMSKLLKILLVVISFILLIFSLSTQAISYFT